MTKRITMLFLVITAHTFCSDSQKKMTHREADACYIRLNNIKICSFGCARSMGNVDSETLKNWLNEINELLDLHSLGSYKKEHLRDKKRYILEEVERVVADSMKK